MAVDSRSPRKGTQSAAGYVYVLISAICFALAGVLIKSIDWNALSISGARSILAAGVLYAFLRVQGKRLVLNGPTAIGALINFAMLQTFVISNKLTTAANAIVLQFTMPVWLILIMWVFMHERPRRAAIAACAVIVAGIVCFFFDDLTPDGLLGNVIAIVSGIAYAGVFLLKRMPGCDFESAAFLSFLACAVCGVPTLLQETDFAVTTLLAVVVLGVVQVGCAYIFLSMGLDRVSPVAAALLSTIEPILNPIIVAIVIGETIGPLSLFGAVLVIGGATVYNVYDAKTG
ncbi:MAG: EamA family transporter [Eggerthellaceae bacterium]|nr:EamA family transporter [Eggerthellaceae bacterium]